MPAKQDENMNWQAFGLRMIAEAKRVLSCYERRDRYVGSMSLATAKWILEEAGMVKLIDVEEEEMKKQFGGHR